MKRHLILIVLLLRFFHLTAQRSFPTDSLIGEYQGNLGYPIICRVQPEGGRLILKIVGIAKVEMTAVKNNTYRLKGVQPEANITFFADSRGKVDRFRWDQKTSSVQW